MGYRLSRNSIRIALGTVAVGAALVAGATASAAPLPLDPAPTPTEASPVGSDGTGSAGTGSFGAGSILCWLLHPYRHRTSGIAADHAGSARMSSRIVTSDVLLAFVNWPDHWPLKSASWTRPLINVAKSGASLVIRYPSSESIWTTLGSALLR